VKLIQLIGLSYIKIMPERTNPIWSCGQGVGLRTLACWDYGFESSRGHECLLECCVFSGRGLCVRLITRAEESYRLWCV